MSYDGYIDEKGNLVPAAQVKPQTAKEWADMIATMSGKESGGNWFVEGETVSLSGHLFRVKGVKPTEIRLKLVERRKDNSNA